MQCVQIPYHSPFPTVEKEEKREKRVTCSVVAGYSWYTIHPHVCHARSPRLHGQRPSHSRHEGVVVHDTSRFSSFGRWPLRSHMIRESSHAPRVGRTFWFSTIAILETPVASRVHSPRVPPPPPPFPPFLFGSCLRFPFIVFDITNVVGVGTPAALAEFCRNFAVFFFFVTENGHKRLVYFRGIFGQLNLCQLGR